MIRQAFLPYGNIDSVYLVHKEGKPACYGFVNFHDHGCAAAALAAANEEQIVLIDKRETVWHVKAEWTTTTSIPKKPKKKRNKGGKDAKAAANKENGFVNGVDGFKIPMPESGRTVQCGPLSYSVNDGTGIHLDAFMPIGA
jgi:RNA recognition motif-containing protein